MANANDSMIKERLKRRDEMVEERKHMVSKLERLRLEKFAAIKQQNDQFLEIAKDDTFPSPAGFQIEHQVSLMNSYRCADQFLL